MVRDLLGFLFARSAAQLLSQLWQNVIWQNGMLKAECGVSLLCSLASFLLKPGAYVLEVLPQSCGSSAHICLHEVEDAAHPNCSRTACLVADQFSFETWVNFVQAYWHEREPISRKNAAQLKVSLTVMRKLLQAMVWAVASNV